MKKAVAILLLLSTIFVVGCGDEEIISQSDVEIEEVLTMTRFRFSYQNPMAGSYNVEIRERNSGAISFDFETYFDFSEGAEDSHVKSEKNVDEAVFEEIAKICEKHDIYSWDGFQSEAYEGAMDTEITSIYIEFSDETTVSASASGGFPENHQEFYEDLHEYTLTIAKENDN